MYGSMDDTGNKEGDSLVNNTVTDNVVQMDNPINFSLQHPFKEEFTEEFWNAVERTFNDSNDWSHSLLVNRVSVLTRKCEADNKNVVEFFFDTFDNFKKVAIETWKEYLIPSFIQEMTKLCVFAIKEDEDDTYRSAIKDDKTVLHLAAERDLFGIAQCIIEIYPKQCYSTTDDDELPLELAIVNGCDQVASFLVKSMNKERVRMLFECGSGKISSQLNFGNLCTNGKMKKTTEAVLDSLYEPNFHYSPVPDEKETQEIWSKLKDEPTSYNFYYRLLDGDSNGRPAKIEEPKGSNTFIYNPDFEKTSFPGLYYLAYGPFSAGLISHPVIRHLIQRKWNNYGSRIYKGYFLFYLFYLLVMTLAYFLGNDRKDLNTYKTSLDIFRGVCEALTLVCAILLFLYEIEQVTKLGKLYLKDGFNYLTVIGSALTISWYLSKWFEQLAGSKSTTIQWSIASVGYLFSVTCVFRYFTAHKLFGVYIRTFIRIIYVEISMFMVVFAIIMSAFTGSVILAMRATDGFLKAKMSAVEVLLQELRALLEGEAFANDYIGVFSAGVIILLMLNMLTVIIIMANVLIGQINNTYNDAVGNANVQFDVDLLRIVIRLDRGSFFTERNRIDYYVDTIYESDADKLQEIVKEWNDLKSGTIKTL